MPGPRWDKVRTMRALVTGSRGTVGRVLARQLAASGATVVGWDRSAVPIDRYDAMDRFVAEAKPDVLFHLAIASESSGRENDGWLVNYEWTSELAWICRTRNVAFVFTSTAMVFSDNAIGPFTPSSIPDATSGYGYEKRMAEARVRHQCPSAVIVRLGWQIGELPDGQVEPKTNSMLAALDEQARTNAEVRASTRWLPACSFLEDTCSALRDAASAPPALYMIDSNARWTYFEIVAALRTHYQRDWQIVPTEDFVFDQRLVDPRLRVPNLDARLRALRALVPQGR